MAKLTVLSFGGGQDSTAILYKYIYDADFRAKYASEDFLVIMSDTGDEHASTYKHVKEVQELCQEHSIEFVFITEGMGYHGAWGNLRSQMKRTNTIFSKAFPKSCTDKLKLVPIYNWLEDHIKSNGDYIYDMAFRAACGGASILRESGKLSASTRKKIYNEFARVYGKIDVLIGFAAGEEKRLPTAKDINNAPKWQQIAINKVFPLVDLNMDRQACQDYIRSVGHTVPTPSNCVLCPWMNEIELVYLHRFHRSDFEEWVQLEQNKIQANLDKGDKNLGVWGTTTLLPEKAKEALGKYGEMTDRDLIEYKMSHGHCVASKY